MEIRRRRMMLIIGAAVVGTLPLAAALDAAPDGVALAVAIAAIVALVASSVWTGLLMVTAWEDEEAGKRAAQLRVRVHLPIMLAAPLLVAAAHPWGLVSLVVAYGALLACQVLILHPMLVIGSIRQSRARLRRPRA